MHCRFSSRTSGLLSLPPRERNIAVMSTNPIMMNGDEDELELFVALHAGALQSSGIPPIYWRSLHHKITNEVCCLFTVAQKCDAEVQ